MSFSRAIVAGLRSLFNRKGVDSETSDELAHWLEQATREHMRAGMSRADAERAARVELGSMTAAQEEARSGGWEVTVESVVQDVRYGLRALRRSPGFALIAIATIALGVGANTTMFSVVNAVMLRPLPWRDADNIALVWTDDVKRGLHHESTAWSTIMDWRSANHSFEDFGYYMTQRVSPVSGDLRTRTRHGLVSGNVFAMLSVRPLRGRVISPQDESERATVAVISHQFWQRWFNGDTSVIGKTVSLDGGTKAGGGQLTVIGVMPPDFYFPDRNTDIWSPSTIYWRFERERSMRLEVSGRNWTAIGRLARGVSLDAARADLARINARLATQYTPKEEQPGFASTVLPVLDSIAGQNVQSMLWVLLGAVTLVLLVACVNVASLMLARGASRQQEFAVRRAIGAGRGRIVRQLLVESIVLALIGGSAGVLIAAWGTGALGSAAAAYVPRVNEITTDWRVLLFALAASVAAGLTFGLGPALKFSSSEASEALKEGGQATGRVRLRRSRGFLVAAECALAIVLLTGAGLLLRSLDRLQSVDPGFDPRHVLTARIEFAFEPRPAAIAQGPSPEIGWARARESIMSAFLARVRSIRGVEDVGFIDDLFMAGQGNESITIPGHSPEDFAPGELSYGVATPGFFSVLRVPVRRGRNLSADDAAQRIRALWSPLQPGLSLAEKERLAVAEPVVVNEAFVRRFYPNDDPIGKRFCTDPNNKTYWYEIVGIAGDMHRGGLEKAAIPEFFGHYFPSPMGRSDLLVRVAGDPLALAGTIRQEILRAYPSATVVSISTADAGLGDFSALRRLQTVLLTLFALLAMALAAIGIFGLVHYSVVERTREIGVRVALGATPGDVLQLVIGQGMQTPAIGILIGLVASAGLTRVIESLLFGIGVWDAVTFTTVALVLTTVAAVACYIAGRRAVDVDPVAALRA